MVKKTITYEDFDGNTRTEDFYFNLSKNELIDMNYSKKGGLDKIIEKMIKTKDAPGMILLVKDLVRKSYGVKSEDGREFMKSKKIRKAFEQTNAYSELFMSLAANEEEALAFIKGIMPKDLAEEAEKRKDEIAKDLGVELVK